MNTPCCPNYSPVPPTLPPSWPPLHEWCVPRPVGQPCTMLTPLPSLPPMPMPLHHAAGTPMHHPCHLNCIAAPHAHLAHHASVSRQAHAQTWGAPRNVIPNVSLNVKVIDAHTPKIAHRYNPHVQQELQEPLERPAQSQGQHMRSGHTAG